MLHHSLHNSQPPHPADELGERVTSIEQVQHVADVTGVVHGVANKSSASRTAAFLTDVACSVLTQNKKKIVDTFQGRIRYYLF